MEDQSNWGMPVPLQPKTCHRCKEKRMRMEFYGKSAVCKYCTLKVKNLRPKMKGYQTGWGLKISHDKRLECDKE